jgi:hypothetical protein
MSSQKTRIDLAIFRQEPSLTRESRIQINTTFISARMRDYKERRARHIITFCTTKMDCRRIRSTNSRIAFVMDTPDALEASALSRRRIMRIWWRFVQSIT